MDLSSIQDHFLQGWVGLGHAIAQPAWGNFFWLLVTVSVMVNILEIAFPWRKKQSQLRPQLGLDLFYMFFNMFVFPLLGYALLSSLLAAHIESFAIVQSLRGWISLHALPSAVQVAVLFVLRDFLQWNIHRILHIVPFFWKLHEVHHSAEIMSYPVHLRYHWAENILYRVPEYLIFLLIAASTPDVFWIYALSLFVGHLSHANLKLPWGFLKYIFNTSELHLWHHAKQTPSRYGVNYALTLSLWDWLFGTAYNPPQPPAEIGLADEPNFPRGFFAQLVWPWGS